MALKNHNISSTALLKLKINTTIRIIHFKCIFSNISFMIIVQIFEINGREWLGSSDTGLSTNITTSYRLVDTSSQQVLYELGF